MKRFMVGILFAAVAISLIGCGSVPIPQQQTKSWPIPTELAAELKILKTSNEDRDKKLDKIEKGIIENREAAKKFWEEMKQLSLVDLKAIDQFLEMMKSFNDFAATKLSDEAARKLGK